MKQLVFIVFVLLLCSCDNDNREHTAANRTNKVVLDTCTKLSLKIVNQKYVDFYIYREEDTVFVTACSYYFDECTNPMIINVKHGNYMIIAVCNEWNAYNNEIVQYIRHYTFDKMSFYFGQTE